MAEFWWEEKFVTPQQRRGNDGRLVSDPAHYVGRLVKLDGVKRTWVHGDRLYCLEVPRVSPIFPTMSEVIDWLLAQTDEHADCRREYYTNPPDQSDMLHFLNRMFGGSAQDGDRT